jgi:lauroyl/myristoyl acyltransferase
VTTIGSRGGRPADRVAVALGFAWGHLRWLDPSARRRSRLAVAAIAGPGEVPDRVAREHLGHAAALEQVIRRPRMILDGAVEGGTHLASAKAAGQGVLVSYCHFGPFPAIGVSALECASDVHQVVGGWLVNPHSISGRARRWRSIFERAGVPVIEAKGCFARVADLLRGGAVVVMAFDWPGSAESSFLGKRVMLASGSARLAESTGALLVPAMRRFSGLRVCTTFDAPLDPAAHGGWRALHDVVAARHERWIRECPAALEDPRRAGAWENAATADGWGLSQPARSPGP